MSILEIDEVKLNVEIPAELHHEMEVESKRSGLPVQTILNKIIYDHYMDMSIDEQEPDEEAKKERAFELNRTRISDIVILLVILSGILLIGALTFIGLEV